MRNLTLILCVIALAGSVMSGVLYFQIGNTKRELFQRWQNSEAQLTAAQTRVASLETQRDELTTRTRTLDADLAAAKRELTENRLQLDQLRDALDLAEESRITAVADRDAARTELSAAQQELVAVRRQLATSMPPAEAQRYRRNIVDLENRIGQLEHALVQKNRDPALVAGRAHHAQVLKVGPQNSFVVINFGSQHGAAPNQRFQIQRGTAALAQAEISLTKEHYSIAQVLPHSLSGTLRKGDAAFITP